MNQPNTTKIVLPELVLKELFVDQNALRQKLGLSSYTLQTLRKDGSLMQGVHYSEVNSRLILYNLPLMIDWLVNRHDPAAHLTAVENFLSTLPSSLPKLKARKPINTCGNE